MTRELTFGAYALPSYHPDTDPPQGVFMRRLLDLLASAEPLGFDAIWLNEHHFNSWGGMLPSPPMALAALSQRTQRVRLGTSIAVLGMHHPIEVAEQMAMLDLMSGGRLEFGVGRGSEAFDYEAYGVDYGAAQARTIEALDIVLQAWTGEFFERTGTYFQVPRIQVWPRPEQRPHPPVWFSCSSNPASFEWTARQGHHLLSLGFPMPVAKFAELTRAYQDAWQDSGRDPNSYQIGTLYHTVVCERGDRARELAIGAFQRFLGQLRESRARPTLHQAPERASVLILDEAVPRLIDEGRLIAGSPREVADTLSYLQGEVGFTQLNLMFQLGGLSFEVAHESMQLFAREVIPRLKLLQNRATPAAAAS
jgi:alkanesulfonate monooxygenase SsuD/methylene tetrahydromethanopterin reductase-like flavin-dependent oxidoreductase (luciferase family)